MTFDTQPYDLIYSGITSKNIIMNHLYFEFNTNMNLIGDDMVWIKVNYIIMTHIIMII